MMQFAYYFTIAVYIAAVGGVLVAIGWMWLKGPPPVQQVWGEGKQIPQHRPQM